MNDDEFEMWKNSTADRLFPILKEWNGDPEKIKKASDFKWIWKDGADAARKISKTKPAWENSQVSTKA